MKKINDTKENPRFDLISIGDLSKLTGVNIKSLRYYEKIGVLLPAYVDPDSRYRYYTYGQVSMVLSIQFYVNMGIPLSILNNYIDEETQIVNFEEQISYGMEIAALRIEFLQKQLENAQWLKEEIRRCDRALTSKKTLRGKFKEKKMLRIPVYGSLTEQKYYSALRQLLSGVPGSGIRKGGETGILYLYEHDRFEQYVFAELEAAGDGSLSKDPRCFQIPEQEWFYKAASFLTFACTDELCEATGTKETPHFTILTELFPGLFDYRKPDFELRWDASNS